MSWGSKIKELKSLPLWGLLVSILFSSIILIVINYYTLKTMSAMRAYINGESSYSKGEKDATQSLIAYMHTQDARYWEAFVKNIGIPHGDSVARVTLLNEGPMETVRKGFLQGNNDKDDIEDMTWLLNSFRNLPMMARPLATWKEGDSLIYQKRLIASQIQSAILNGTLEDNETKLLVALNENSKVLTLKENEFSESLGAVARKIKDYLFYANAIIILLILGNVSAYAMIMVRKRNEQNTALTHANKELDRMAYAVSHDLRAPIHSMLGLVNLAQRENDQEKLKPYLDIMRKTLDRQERFIKEMIALSKENRLAIRREIVDLYYLVEQVINTHKHMPEASHIEFAMHIGVHRVFTDPRRLEIVLNNLVSNAIKYHDPTKGKKSITINTYSKNDKVIIDVTDNGIGIDIKDKTKIFEMYYMSRNQEKGTGLGLFIVKEAIKKLEGDIEVKSVKGEGSTFSVVLKK